jgi:hypothetical protein
MVGLGSHLGRSGSEAGRAVVGYRRREGPAAAEPGDPEATSFYAVLTPVDNDWQTVQISVESGLAIFSFIQLTPVR